MNTLADISLPAQGRINTSHKIFYWPVAWL